MRYIQGPVSRDFESRFFERICLFSYFAARFDFSRIFCKVEWTRSQNNINNKTNEGKQDFEIIQK